MKRRDLCAGLALLSSGITVRGGGADGGTLTAGPQDTDSALSVEWDIRAALAFVVGGSASIDLNDTLPEGVPRGGTFGVNNTGSPLPSGLTLTPDGKLSASSAAVGLTTGVMFTYRPA